MFDAMTAARVGSSELQVEAILIHGCGGEHWKAESSTAIMPQSPATTTETVSRLIDAFECADNRQCKWLAESFAETIGSVPASWAM